MGLAKYLTWSNYAALYFLHFRVWQEEQVVLLAFVAVFDSTQNTFALVRELSQEKLCKG